MKYWGHGLLRLRALWQVRCCSSSRLSADRDDARWHGHIERFHEHDWDLCRRGYWRHEFHDGRWGWWWIVGPIWYYYPEPVYPYPNPYEPPVAGDRAAQAQRALSLRRQFLNTGTTASLRGATTRMCRPARPGGGAVPATPGSPPASAATPSSPPAHSAALNARPSEHKEDPDENENLRGRYWRGAALCRVCNDSEGPAWR